MTRFVFGGTPVFISRFRDGFVAEAFICNPEEAEEIENAFRIAGSPYVDTIQPTAEEAERVIKAMIDEWILSDFETCHEWN